MKNNCSCGCPLCHLPVVARQGYFAVFEKRQLWRVSSFYQHNLYFRSLWCHAWRTAMCAVSSLLRNRRHNGIVHAKICWTDILHTSLTDGVRNGFWTAVVAQFANSLMRFSRKGVLYDAWSGKVEKFAKQVFGLGYLLLTMLQYLQDLCGSCKTNAWTT